MFGGRPHRWEPPTGFAVAEEHLGQGVGELLAREPGHQHRRDLVGPGQQDRRAGIDDHDGAGLAAATRRTSSSWRPGRARASRSKPSLSTSSVVPTTTTATSASAASATARSSSSVSEACLARLSWKVTTATSASPNPPVSDRS